MGQPWTVDVAAPDLRAQSCPDPDARANSGWTDLPLTVTPIDLDPKGAGLSLPPGVNFAGGWALSSANKHLGGLSGLSVLPDNRLLSVSDTGRFIELGLANGRPDGTARLASMRFENPLIRPGKLTADAEGLDFQNGIAFVSFERNFRVLAFDLSGCGGDAKGIEIATPSGRFGKTRVRANAGPEALYLDPKGGLHIIYEQLKDGEPVQGQVLLDGSLHMRTRPPLPALADGFRPVGADQIVLHSGPPVEARLYRAYDRARGNRIRLDFGVNGHNPWQINLQPPLLTDNFEGVTLQETDTGLRAYIISDDNFSDRQQTLLYAFDIDLSRDVDP